MPIMRAGLACIALACLALVSCSEPSHSPSAAAVAPVGVASDEPCSRSLPLDAMPPSIGYHVEDLERMVLSRADLGGLPGFEIDPISYGYQGNGELETVEVHPEGMCDAMARLGRVTGFSGSFAAVEATGHVSTTAHLFWDEPAARGWLEWFVAGMQSSVGAGNDRRLEVRPLPGGRPGDVLMTHRGADGTRTWAMFVRASILGWVVDLAPPQRPTIDVPVAAAAMAKRIEAVEADVAARRPSGLDAAALLSAPLPLVAYGEPYAGLAWDSFFGGCADAVERGLVAGPAVADDARRFGRLSGCTALYGPGPGADDGPIERVFSSVSVMATDGGASGAVAKGAADMEELGGRPVGIPVIGDEAVAIVTPPGADRGYTDSRALVRLGSHVLVVAIQDREQGDHLQEVASLAASLVGRVQGLLANIPD
jgi:hypothetical protein